MKSIDISIKLLLINNLIDLRVSSLRFSKNNTSNTVTQKCGRSHFHGSAQRIIGGREARNGEFPWVVSIHSNGKFKCGGSIINSLHVLTAAHCLHREQPLEISIRYNSLSKSNNIYHRSAAKLIIHPKYNTEIIDNDIAIIRLKTPLVLGRLNAGNICLPNKDQKLSEGQLVSVTGWGITEKLWTSDSLLTVDIPIVSINNCRNEYKYLPKLFTITENMLCVGLRSGGMDACTGDSGGPLIKSFDRKVFVLIGIVSKGFGCAQPNMPGVYTKVVNYIDWIQLHINPKNLS